MVQPLLESKLATCSKDEAVHVLQPGDPALAKCPGELGATCLGDTAALVKTAVHWLKRVHQLEDGKVVSLKCFLQHYLYQ